MAHLHHAWDSVRQKKKDYQLILVHAGFQFLYTTLFGWYAALMFAKTGLLLPAIVAHILCNYFGLPSFHSNGNGHVFLICRNFGLTFHWRLFMYFIDHALDRT
jgi:prenyl protein peptidase